MLKSGVQMDSCFIHCLAGQTLENRQIKYTCGEQNAHVSYLRPAIDWTETPTFMICGHYITKSKFESRYLFREKIKSLQNMCEVVC